MITLTQEEITRLAYEYENKTAAEVAAWALQQFGDKVALATSFGAEDMALTDLLVKQHPRVSIFTLDTGRLPEETYRVWQQTEQKYDIHIQSFFPDTEAVEDMLREQGPNLMYQSVELRRRCCQVRKVEPLNRALSGLHAWMTGLRREQAVTRGSVGKIEGDAAHNLVKINPLTDWTEKMVWDYIREYQVPYNELHDRSYPSIGCAPCTRAVRATEDVRAGRWWWESPEKKECGLHK